MPVKKLKNKICSRGHKYSGSGPCVVCWPGSIKKPKKEKYIKYHNDGTLWAKGTLIDGKMEGYWEWFRKPADRKGGEGSKLRSGYFKSGKQTGEWTTYDKSGKVVKVTKFE